MASQSRSTKRSADAQEAAWVADEDSFVLRQAKKKAAIRVKGGRADAIDWLTVALAIIEPDQNPLDDELEDANLDLVNPEALFEDLHQNQLVKLEKEIDMYLVLEKSRNNREYWSMMKAICADRQKTSHENKPAARGAASVASDLENLLQPKSLEELEKLECQIQAKLRSDEPLDTDYWELLLKALLTYKAKAKLRDVSRSIVSARMNDVRRHQAVLARRFRTDLSRRLDGSVSVLSDTVVAQSASQGLRKRHPLDPEPMLRLQLQDKILETMTQEQFVQSVRDMRERVHMQSFTSKRKRPGAKVATDHSSSVTKRVRVDRDSSTQSKDSLFDREVARGLGENEEIFIAEESVETKNKSLWADKYRPRKPRYFNRMQLGYDWNKYNQTHYDHDNPPPRVVQGYKFNVFYPDLVDTTKAPIYRIERENGRKRGQTFAPAGEDDTCIIRFMAGPPYEDLAFRIVDKEWDFSTKRERGFRNRFDKGILQLHFHFKKVFYRK